MAITVTAGQRITTDVLNAFVPLYVNKVSSQSVTSSTTMVADSELFFTLPTGIWAIEFHLFATGAAAGDIRTEWDSSGMTGIGFRGCMGPAAGVTDAGDTNMMCRQQGFTADVIYGTDGTNLSYIREDALMNVTVNNSTVRIQFAQGTSNGTATQMRSGSWGIAHRVS